MAIKFARLFANCAIHASKLLKNNPTLVYRFAQFKVLQVICKIETVILILKNSFISLQKSKPIYLALIGLPLAKKEVDKSLEGSIMSEIKDQLAKADQLFEDNKFAETLDSLKTLDQTNPEVLWRQARALYKVSGSDTSSKKAESIREAYKFVAEALEKDEQNFAVHKWFEHVIFE